MRFFLGGFEAERVYTHLSSFVYRAFLTIFLFLPTLVFSTPQKEDLFHASTYKVGWDIDFSPYAGGEDLLFVHRSGEAFERWILKKTEMLYSQKPQARFWRLTELFLGWLPVNYLAVTVQHEVFGHGYRIRDIGKSKAKVSGYMFDTPPPYGPGGAATSYRITDSFVLTDELTTSIAGVESTAILALLTKFKWLESGFVDPRQSVLYLLSQHDLNLYIGSLKTLNDEDDSGHDISMYVKALNYTYTRNFLSKGRLRSLSWINLADPFTYYAIYAWGYYFLTGKEASIPMIPVYGYGYLPNLRLGLTPFGPELLIENYLVKDQKPIYFYIKGGKHSQNTYYGLGAYVPRMWQLSSWFFGFRLDFFRQPKLLLEQGSIDYLDIDLDVKPNKASPVYPLSEQEEKNFGWAGSLIFGFERMQGFEAELGIKSRGFLPGYSLLTSPTARLFYTLVF